MPKDEGYQAHSVLLAAPVLSLWAASTQMPPLLISTRLAWLNLPAFTYPLVPTISAWLPLALTCSTAQLCTLSY